jgi:NADPH-dependent 2,4-dienoyl-CoA reductase/sulfur reductase-like enzyme
LPGLLSQPATLAKGIYYRSWLTAHGIPVHQGASLTGINGEQRVQSLTWRNAKGDQHLDCDAVAFAHGLRSETQLADLLGCEFAWNPLNRAWLPQCDHAGRSSVAEVYLAGDGAGIMGADAAEMAGERAALALLEDIGYLIPPQRGAQLEQALERIDTFRLGLERAFVFPEHWAADAPNDVMICRCEEVRAGDIRQVVREEHWEINRVKAHCRVGMGRCQGRMCGAAAAEIIACESQRSVSDIGRLRAQAPIKPLPFGLEVES